MADVQTTSLTIQFKVLGGGSGASDQLFVNVDLDESKNLPNSSPFLFGSTVYFRVFTNATTVDIYTSSGSITKGVLETFNVTDDVIVFSLPQLPPIFKKTIEENTASLKYHATSAPTFARITGANLSPSLHPVDTNLVMANGFGIAVFNAIYDTQYMSYSLSGVSVPADFPPDEDFPVVIFIAVS